MSSGPSAGSTQSTAACPRRRPTSRATPTLSSNPSACTAGTRV